MRFVETPIPGAFVIEPERVVDDRGFFARVFDREEAAGHGMAVPGDQWSVSFSERRGTLRGIHYQPPPHEEVKLVRCTSGAIWDVIVDLTSRRWFAIELSASNGRSLYIPAGMGHGFQTLVDDAEVFYAMAGRYEPSVALGVRWDDPSLAIAWPPCEDRVISERDRALPLLSR